MQIVCESLEQSTSDEMKIVGLKAFNSIIIDFYEYHVISCYMGKYLANVLNFINYLIFFFIKQALNF